jgi:hypothetical protein
MNNKLKDVSLKKALEVIGATDIKCSTKGFWYVSARFTLNGVSYILSSHDLRYQTKLGSNEIDLNALPELYYRRTDKSTAPNIFNIHDLFAAQGVRVPHYKLQYDPWNNWKKTACNTNKRSRTAARTRLSIPELNTHP